MRTAKVNHEDVFTHKEQLELLRPRRAAPGRPLEPGVSLPPIIAVKTTKIRLAYEVEARTLQAAASDAETQHGALGADGSPLPQLVLSRSRMPEITEAQRTCIHPNEVITADQMQPWVYHCGTCSAVLEGVPGTRRFKSAADAQAYKAWQDGFVAGESEITAPTITMKELETLPNLPEGVVAALLPFLDDEAAP